MIEPRVFRSAQRVTDDWRRRYSPRGFLLYGLALALIPATVVALIRGHAMAAVLNAAAFTGYMMAGSWLRKGFRAEDPALRDRWLAQRHWPYKTLAALAVAVITGLLAYVGLGHAMTQAGLYAGGAFVGMVLSYGIDRRQKTPLKTADGYSEDEIRQTLIDAYRRIALIEQANRDIIQSELNQRIASICDIAETIVNDLEADPRGIRRARKFLKVYLDSVHQVVQGYADTHRQAGSPTLESNFREALTAIESAFTEQRQKLLDEDVFDLDVKIEVLTSQLKREGIL